MLPVDRFFSHASLPGADVTHEMRDTQRAALDAVVDPGRLAAVGQMDTRTVADDVELDELAKQAALTCRTPVGMVTLLDANRQWNIGRHGTNLAALPIGLSMCAYVVAGGPTVVNDLRFDERFSRHPLVQADNGLRFYAGVPVQVEGVVAGALAVADVRPRNLTPAGRNRLTELARSASEVLARVIRR